jgi:hypothetical protein
MRVGITVDKDSYISWMYCIMTEIIKQIISRRRNFLGKRIDMGLLTKAFFNVILVNFFYWNPFYHRVIVVLNIGIMYDSERF